MHYVVFARKYRPQGFDDVVGQEHITRTLKNAVRTGRVAQAYLFCGSRGIGKTTMARILAKALNCKDGPTTEPCGECESCRRIANGDDMDVIEIDGASNRRIEDVRELRQKASVAAARSRFKIYYIDEVHMLTKEAFNALLKTLEEPPSHVKFIFSTTETEKIPETITSRCQRFDFRRLSDADVVRWLEEVCAREGLKVEEGGLAAIARAARGSMRDALGTLDQLAAFGDEIALKDVLLVLGAVDRRVLGEMVDALAVEDTAAALSCLHQALFDGTDAEVLAGDLSEYLRDLLVTRYCGAGDGMLGGAAAAAELLRRQTELFTADQLTYMIQVLREAALRARRDTTGRLALELAIVKISRLSELVPLEQALDGLSGPGGPANPGPAAATGRRAAPPGRSGAPRSTAGMRQRLKNAGGGTNSGRSAGGNDGGPATRARENGPAVATAAPAPPRPEGMDEVTYRRLVSCADDPQAGREALTHEALVEAFTSGNKTLGLEPVRLERFTPPRKPLGHDAEEPDETEHTEEET